MCFKHKNKKITKSLSWTKSITSCHKIVWENEKLKECPFIRISIFCVPGLYRVLNFPRGVLKKINPTKSLKMIQWIFWTGRTYTLTKSIVLKAKKSRSIQVSDSFFKRYIFLLRAEQHGDMLRIFSRCLFQFFGQLVEKILVLGDWGTQKNHPITTIFSVASG